MAFFLVYESDDSRGLNRDLVVPLIERIQTECQLIDMTGDIDYRSEKAPSEVPSFFLNDPEAFNKTLQRFLTGHEKPLQLKEFPVPGMQRSLTLLASY